MSRSFSQLYCQGNSTVQATTSTPALLVAPATQGPSSNLIDGNQSIVPLATLQQFTLVREGIYKISFHGSVKLSAASTLVIQAYINGITALANLISELDIITAEDTSYANISFEGYYNNTQTVTVANPVLSLFVSTSASINTLFNNCQFNVERMD